MNEYGKKTSIREVIFDNDSVTITYNFTENYTKYKISKETIEEIKRQSLKKTAYNKNRCSNKLPSLPPKTVKSGPKRPLFTVCGNRGANARAVRQNVLPNLQKIMILGNRYGFSLYE